MEFFGKMPHGQSMTVGFTISKYRNEHILSLKISDRKRNHLEQEKEPNFSVLVPPGKSMRMEVNDVDRLGKFEVNVAEKEEAGVAVDVSQTSRFHLVLSETEKFTFFVSGPMYKTPIEFQLKKDDNQKEYTVGMVKKKILEHNGTPDETLHLFCNSGNTREVLEDSRTLASYGFLQRALFRVLVSSEKPEKRILVEYDGRGVKMWVRNEETVGSLKEKLKEKFGMPTEEQRLQFSWRDGWLNDDARTLASYPSFKESVTMERRRKLKMKISVRCMFKKTLKIEVCTLETIGNVKKRIQEKRGYAVDEQILRFGKKVLENESQVGDYKIKEESEMVLSFRRK